MLKLIRSGPKLLMVETGKPKAVTSLLQGLMAVKEFDVPQEITSEYVHRIFDQATERHVVVLMTSDLSDIVSFHNLNCILLVSGEVFEVQSALINHDVDRLVTGCRMAPGMIIMKLIGNEEKIVHAVQTDYDAEYTTILRALDRNSSGTVISFTRGDIKFPVSHGDFHERALYTNVGFRDVIQNMRIHNLKYLNIGLDNEDWYELKIKIYDAYGDYLLHYERLRFIMEKLDLGLILGESWGTDAAMVFLSVGVYKVRFFTFLNPVHIKRILLGLEFLEGGQRIVDYDLYHKRRKIHWDVLREPHLDTREALSSIIRGEILEQLSDDEKKTLLEMETRILEARASH